MGEVVGALRHMHSLRVVHRDLSSTNLLIDERDGIKLSDFGNAAQLPPVGPMARENRTVGTPYYMSPQAVRSEPPSGGETDVWSFGVVCFELLTLQRPFRAQSYEALAPLIVAGAYDKAALHASPHDAALCALVTSDALLHVDVERRATLAHVDKVLDSLAHLYAEPEVPADALAAATPSAAAAAAPTGAIESSPSPRPTTGGASPSDVKAAEVAQALTWAPPRSLEQGQMPPKPRRSKTRTEGVPGPAAAAAHTMTTSPGCLPPPPPTLSRRARSNTSRLRTVRSGEMLSAE
jgi:NIMA (never in mitosis gene a)-related kinase